MILFGHSIAAETLGQVDPQIFSKAALEQLRLMFPQTQWHVFLDVLCVVDYTPSSRTQPPCPIVIPIAL